MSRVMPECLQRCQVAYYQRGNVMLMAMLCFTLMVACVVLALDAGRLYFERQNLQRIADLIALDIVADENGIDVSRANAEFVMHGLRVAEDDSDNEDDGRNDKMSLRSGTLRINDEGRRGFEPDTQVDAVEVILTRTVPGSLIPNLAAILPGATIYKTVPIQVSAVAYRPQQVTFMAGTSLITASVSASPPTLLGRVLSQMLGTNLDLSLISFEGLLSTHLTLLELAGALGLNITPGLSPETVLSTQVTAIDLVEAGINVLSGKGVGSELQVLQYLRGSNSSALHNQRFDLGQIIGSVPESLNADFSVGQLLNAAVYAANRRIDVSVPDLLGVAKADIGIVVTQPPKVAVGRPGCKGYREVPCQEGDWMTEARPAQLELDFGLITNLLGIIRLDLDVDIDTTPGRVVLESVTANNLRGEEAYDLRLRGQATALSINTDARISVLNSLLRLTGTNRVNRSTEIPGNPFPGQVLDLTWPGSENEGTISSGTGAAVATIGDDLRRLNFSLSFGGGLLELISFLLNFAVGTLLELTGALTQALNMLISNVIEPQLDPLLRGLGIDVAPMDVKVLRVSSGTVELAD